MNLKVLILCLSVSFYCFSYQGRSLAQIEDLAPCEVMNQETASSIKQLIQEQAPQLDGLYLLDYFCEACGDAQDVPQMIETIDIVAIDGDFEVYFDGTKVNISNYYLNRTNLALQSQCVKEVVLPTI
jgi:hypothetical protein